MKKMTLRSVRCALALLACLGQAHGADRFWSANGTTAGGAGTWDTSNAHFGTAAGGPFGIVWDNTANAGDSAQFNSSGGAVVIQAGGITAKEVEINTTGCSFSGGMLTLGSGGINLDVNDTVTFSNAFTLAVNQTWYGYSANVIDAAGPLSGTGKITQGGGGPSATIILRGDNSAWSGGIETGKPIQLGHDNALGTGAFTMGAGTVSAIGGPRTFAVPLYKWVPNSDATIAFGGANRMEFTGTFTIDAGINPHYLAFLITNTEEIEFSGNIVQAAGDSWARDVVKSGAGVLIFSGDNTYFGETRVTAGELWVNGTTSGQDDYIVQSGGTLGGTGTVGLAAGKTFSVQGGGTLTPGTPAQPIGTLAVTGGVSLDTSAVYAWEYDSTADLLDVDGAVTLTDATLDLDITGSLNPTLNYTLIECTSHSGTFLTVNGLPASHSLDYSDSTKIILRSATANEAPTDIALSNTNIAESAVVGTTVGTLSTTDPNAGDTFTYTLAAGDGDTNNASFTIDGTALKTTAAFDYEATNALSVRVRTTDQGGLWSEKAFSIAVTNVNEAPTALDLSPSSVPQGQPAGTAVGAFSSTDPDAGDTFTYTFASGAGDADNASFTIDGDTLKTAEIFDYDTQNSYSIRVRTTDSGTLSFETTFSVDVLANAPPTDIALSDTNVAENATMGTVVGTLSTTDPDTGNTFTYTLVAGVGDTGNACFAIDGDALETAAVFDYEATNSYSVRVRSTDQGSLWVEEAFTIAVTNVNDAPTAIALSNASVLQGLPVGVPVGTFSTTDDDPGDTFTYALASGTGGDDNASFTVDGAVLKTAEVFHYATKSSYTIRVRTTDAGALSHAEPIAITIKELPDTRYWSGDGNSVGGTGTWDTSNPHWSTSAGGPFSTTWHNAANSRDTARFDAPTGTVTMNAGGLTAGGIYVGTGGYTFDGPGPMDLGSGGINHRSGVSVFNVPIALSANQPWAVIGNKILEINGPLSGSGRIALSGGGGESGLTLNGDNAGWSGGMSIGGHVLQLGSSSALGSGQLELKGSTAILSATTSPATVGNALFLALARDATKTIELAGDHAMTFTGDIEIDPGIDDGWLRFNVTSAELMTFSGVIKQQAGQPRNTVKLGDGTLVLSGADTYDGTTTVEAGTLYLDGTTTGMDDHIVQTGSTLGGTGTVGLATGRALGVESGGTLAPGTAAQSVGTLTVNGDVMLAEGATYVWAYQDSAGDLADVNGMLTLPTVATVVVSQVSGSLPAIPTLFTFDSRGDANSLDGWVVQGVQGYTATVKGNSVVLRIKGTLFRFR